MKTRITTTATSITAIGAIALVALSGCSNSNDPAPSGNGAPATEQEVPTSDAVFDFTSRDAIAPGPSISFEIPEGLLAVATDYADTRFLDTVTVTGLETESAKFCAARIEFGYADGDATRALIEDTNWQANVAEGTELEIAERYVLALGMHFAATDAPQIGEPDLANLEASGAWIAPDGKSAVQIVKCASSPYDPDAQNVVFGFTSHKPYEAGGPVEGITPDPNKFDATVQPVPLAEAWLSVMKNGDVTLMEHEVNGFVLDSNGSWIEG